MRKLARSRPRQMCPCHSGLTYGKCCREAHRNGASGPEALMRSRYAAYALEKVSYIMETSAEPERDPDTWRAEIQRFCEHTAFLGLEILEVEPGDEVAYVTFRARLQQVGHDASFTERSRFVRRHRWLYESGERIA
ncbi:MAG: YchJ family metal-binding protein [Myxococcota bacterium]